MHVDDILIHVPTWSKLFLSLNIIMDTIYWLVLFTRNTKKKSTQISNMCIFLYDTSSYPTLVIPDKKITRAKAMIQYLQHVFQSKFSRLVVSMIIWFRQPLVPTTPDSIWASFLCHFYTDLHCFQDGDNHGTKALYYNSLIFREYSQLCLIWWSTSFALGVFKQPQPIDIVTIGVA